MFEELQTNINTQNFMRVRQNQNLLDHSVEADDSLHGQESESNEFSERLQMFHILMENPSSQKTT